MVASASFALLLASFGAAGVRAIVTPNEPGPGSVYNEGSTCHIQWAGDKDGKWDNMAIQLMTGDNFQMVHLTTVATGQDGNKDGKFDYPCPEVTPNSAIYFYQFSSPDSSELTWATRFTIADAQGKSVAPENPTQPGTGAAIPWGTGALVDPSSAVPPPTFAGGASTGTNTTTSTGSTGTSTTGTGTGAGTGTGTGAGAGAGTGTTGTGNTGGTSALTPTMTTSLRSTATLGNNNPVQSSQTSQGTTGNTTSSNSENSAFSVRVASAWQATIALAVSASAFALFL